MANESDEFLFNVAKWFADLPQQRMSFSEKGVYLDMLFKEWTMKEKSLPDDPRAVADLIAINESQVAEVLAAWPVVRRKFVSDRRANGEMRIYNIKLEKVRRLQAKKFLEIRNRARGAGKASAAKRRRIEDLGVNGRSTAVEPPSTVRLGKEGLGQERLGEVGLGQVVPPAVEVTARSKRPIFKGTRFVVFEWQYDDLCRMLGPHADTFDLDEWFHELNRRAERASDVVPQRDGGAWLQARTLEEARQRGLTVASATPATGSKRVEGLMRGGEAFLNRVRA
jgi:uncharacterized protein YdaU (DUF1376 family)